MEKIEAIVTDYKVATFSNFGNGSFELGLNFYGTFLSLLLVLLLGRLITKRVTFLRNYDIPEPVTGGVVVAIVLFIASYYLNFHVSFYGGFKDPLLLAFYTTIGLSADIEIVKKGGKMLGLFAIAVFLLLSVQNAIGVGVMKAMGENPLLGLIGGSITLSGGHGTGAAWGETFIKDYGFKEATDIAMACATYGLIAGGFIGGPMANYLIKKFNLKPSAVSNENITTNKAFDAPQNPRLITSESFITSLILIAVSIFIGIYIEYLTHGTAIAMPTFVWCLITGIIIRNTFGRMGVYEVFDREIGVIGNVSLSLFLAIAIMTLNIVQLVELALPISVLLAIQTIAILIYVRYVTFVICGKDYDAACMVAGHCGFGMGATPTAIANLQVVTNHFGPSHVAFIVVPIMGGFLVDIGNAITIKTFLSFLF